MCVPMLSHVSAVEDLRIAIFFGGIVCCQISVLDITSDCLAKFVKLGARAFRLKCPFFLFHITTYPIQCRNAGLRPIRIENCAIY